MGILKKHAYILPIFLILLLMAFQNCGGGEMPSMTELSSTNTSEDTGDEDPYDGGSVVPLTPTPTTPSPAPTPTPSPTPTPTPTPTTNASCTIGGLTIPHGMSINTYSTVQASQGGCTSTSRTCNNGSLGTTASVYLYCTEKKTLAFKCSDTSAANVHLYKAIGQRCGEAEGIASWTSVINSQGLEKAKTLFRNTYDDECNRQGATNRTTCNSKIFCPAGFTYTPNSDYCLKTVGLISG